MKYIITLIVLFALGWLFVWLPITGIHYSTGSGTQVGYVSAIEKTGLIFKTGRVYIKPTLESTQEDVYCVVDDVVHNQLKAFSVDKTRVEVSHLSWLVAGLSNCELEDAVVLSVRDVAL